MDILLLGEFSSLHKFLKEGLEEVGNYKITLVANGDGWKKIGGNDDILFSNPTSSISKPYHYLIEPFLKAKKFKEYDVVQFINTQIYPTYINELLMKRIAKRNTCISLVAAGEDYRLYEAYNQNKFDYYVYDYSDTARQRYNKNTMQGILNVHNDKEIEKIADIVIPSMYEYSVGYPVAKKGAIIPLPINIKKIDYQENYANNKIVFFHGINREADKGTPFIRAALKKLVDRYPNDVEVIIDGHLPYEHYVNIMKKANVVLDQCCCYSYGINACIAMAQGKIVMAGNRKETREALGVSECPIIHIQPDVDYIYDKLIRLLENRQSITDMGYKSRIYVEEVHDNVKIAQKYLDTWKSTGKL